MRICRGITVVLLAVLMFACTEGDPENAANQEPEQATEGTAPPRTEIHKEAVRSLIEWGWNEGEVSVITSTLADTVTFHYAGSPREQMGIES